MLHGRAAKQYSFKFLCKQINKDALENPALQSLSYKDLLSKATAFSNIWDIWRRTSVALLVVHSAALQTTTGHPIPDKMSFSGAEDSECSGESC